MTEGYRETEASGSDEYRWTRRLYRLIPRMPYWFRRLEYRFPYWLVCRTVKRQPATWLPTWLADLWIVATQRMFIAYMPGDPRMTSHTRRAIKRAVAEHDRKMAEDPEYAERQRQKWAEIKKWAVPITDRAMDTGSTDA